MNKSNMSEESKGREHIIIRYEGGKVLRKRNTGSGTRQIGGFCLEVGDVWVRSGKVIDPRKLFYEEKKLPDKVIDCSNLIVSPGFIDLQINGGFGIDFSSLKPDHARKEVSRVSRGLLAHGVTAYCPTIVTSPSEYYKEVLHKIAPSSERRGDEALVLGVHCEGPFINVEKKGAHKEEHIVSSISPQLVQDYYGQIDNNNIIKIVTIAPELPGAEETTRWLKEKGVVVSLGHSMATLKSAEDAVKSGASLITHLFNAMLPFHHRDPGIVGLLTSLDLNNTEVFYGIISDGFHTHDTVQRLSYRANKRGIVLVTDAMAAMDLPDGEHKLGEMTIDVKNGAARLAGKPTLAGSVATMDKCVRYFMSATDCSTAEALVAATLHPAQVLGIADRKGTLEYGADADMVLLNEELFVEATCIGGKIVWRRPGSSIGVTSHQ